MNNIKDFDKCANCGACYNACPTNAISIDRNSAFFSLKLDEQKCISCGLCKQACPVNNPVEAQNIQKAYGGAHYDTEAVRTSSSGGAFSAIANIVLKNGGIVYGAAFDNQFRSVVIKGTDEVSIEALKKSKYVESEVGFSFGKIKEQLENGKEVLFCGAPCQVAGLKRYLKKDYENLLTCDFSCGGMPSHKLYEEYLQHIENKLKAPIISVDFRPKIYGWSIHAMKILSENGKEYKKIYKEDPYLKCFIDKHISVRDYCYECDFANNHYADIILADLWKHKIAKGIINTETGLSLIITNSPKGEKYIERIKNCFAITTLDIKEAGYNLVKKEYSKAFLDGRKQFLLNCEKTGFIKAAKKVKSKGAFKLKLKYYVKKLLGRI